MVYQKATLPRLPPHDSQLVTGLEYYRGSLTEATPRLAHIREDGPDCGRATSPRLGFHGLQSPVLHGCDVVEVAWTDLVILITT